jgi:hypothetical protein
MQSKAAARRSKIVAALMVLPVLGFAAFSILQNLYPDTAGAHSFSATPQVRIHFKKGRFYGRIASHRLPCKRNRQVTLLRARRGISDIIVGRTRTGPLGRWKIPRRNPHGRYYAKIYRKVATSYGHNHRCAGDQSRKLFVQ